MIAVRAMSEADLDVVFANEIAAYVWPWSRVNLQDCLREGKDCRVILVDDAIVGHGVLAVAVGEGHVLNVCIAPAAQGQGLGRILVEHLVDRARLLGAEMIFLEVRASNHVARLLYESMGFNEIAVRRGYYPAAIGREDAEVMALDLRSEIDFGGV